MNHRAPISTKTIAFTSQHITVDSPLPPTEIIARLDKRLNRANASRLFALLRDTTLGKDELKSLLVDLMGDNDFMCVCSKYGINYNKPTISRVFPPDSSPPTLMAPG